MNRKLNTLLFILFSSLLNALLGLLFFVLFFVLYARFIAPNLGGSALGERIRPWFPALIFLAAVGVSFLLYRLGLRLFTRRVDMDRYFTSLFKPAPEEGADKAE